MGKLPNPRYYSTDNMNIGDHVTVYDDENGKTIKKGTIAAKSRNSIMLDDYTSYGIPRIVSVRPPEATA